MAAANIPEHAAVPLTARVLLADDLGGWPGCPLGAKHMLQQWTRLQVAVLGGFWRARCERTEQLLRGTLARRAVTIALENIVGAIKRDWLRTQRDVRTLDDGFFCSAWWRGFDSVMSVDAFERQWAPLFCRVVGPPPAQGELDTRTMVLCLDERGPVPLPD